jgi:hypothetical protein
MGPRHRFYALLVGLLVARVTVERQDGSELGFYALLVGLLVARCQPRNTESTTKSRFYALLVGLLVARTKTSGSRNAAPFLCPLSRATRCEKATACIPARSNRFYLVGLLVARSRTSILSTPAQSFYALLVGLLVARLQPRSSSIIWSWSGGFYALLVGLLVARDRRVAVLVTCRDSTRLRAPRQSGSSWSWRRVLRW